MIAFRLSRRLGTILLALAAMSGAAFAQSPACNAWRSELASLQGQRGGGDARAAQQAQRVGAQLSQLAGQFRAMGCERGGFLFFGEQPPPQCGGIRAQMNQLQAQYQAWQRQAQGGGVDQRRAQLQAMIDGNCRAQPERRGFFETIFGIEPRRPSELDSTMPELDPEQMQPTEDRARMGGPYTVCVRSCDGFFFPLANNPNGGQDEMCQALCPGTETTAFGMSSGGDIQNAVQRSTGTPYASLPNAGKYTRSFDAACTCRAPGQSWVQALRNAEDLLEKRKGDIFVTEQRSLEMSRPKPDVKPDPKADPKRKGQTQPAPAPTSVAADPTDVPMPSENSPTSGTESAGMGPQTIEPDKTVQQGTGVKKESQSVTGERRTVRIVAPNLAPNLGPAATRP